MNWNRNIVGTVADINSKSYHHAGRYLFSYLKDVRVFNCTLSAIKDSTPWPPVTSGRTPEGTYGQFYATGSFAPLHSTYTILWSYQGYNHKQSGHVDKNQSHFEGANRLDSPTKLVVQDALFYLTTNTNLLWPSPQQTWCSSHPFKNGARAHPYWVFKDPGMQRKPKVRLNAGYLDGRVETFNAWDALGVKNYGAQAFISPKYR